MIYTKYLHIATQRRKLKSPQAPSFSKWTKSIFILWAKTFYEQKVEWVTDGRSGPIRLSGLLEHLRCWKKQCLQLSRPYSRGNDLWPCGHCGLAPVGLVTSKQCIILSKRRWVQFQILNWSSNKFQIPSWSFNKSS